MKRLTAVTRVMRVEFAVLSSAKRRKERDSQVIWRVQAEVVTSSHVAWVELQAMIRINGTSAGRFCPGTYWIRHGF